MPSKRNAQSAKISSHTDLARIVASRLSLPLERGWVEIAPASAECQLRTKIMCGRVAKSLQRRRPDLVPQTTTQSSRARLSVLVAKVMFKIVRAIDDPEHAVMHGSRDDVAWNCCNRGRGSGIVLSDVGMAELAKAARTVSVSLR